MQKMFFFGGGGGGGGRSVSQDVAKNNVNEMSLSIFASAVPPYSQLHFSLIVFVNPFPLSVVRKHTPSQWYDQGVDPGEFNNKNSYIA